MILVLLGTQHNEFTRLLKKGEECIDKKIITEKVIVQAGYTKWKSNKMEIFDVTSNEKLNELIDEANLIITHGGVGSITSSLRDNKKVIAVPRLHEFNEHVNNHQKDIVRMFDQKGYIIGIDDLSQLEEAIKRAKTFVPNEYKNNSKNIIKIIEDFIDKI